MSKDEESAGMVARAAVSIGIFAMLKLVCERLRITQEEIEAATRTTAHELFAYKDALQTSAAEEGEDATTK